MMKSRMEFFQNYIITEDNTWNSQIALKSRTSIRIAQYNAGMIKSIDEK